MRIDAHHHVWDLKARPQPWTEPFPVLAQSYGFDDLRPALATTGIDATVVVQTVTVAEETPELLAIADQDRTVAGVVGWVDLAAADVAEKLAALRSSPGGRYLVGIRDQVQEEDGTGWFVRSETHRGLSALADQGLTYDLIVRPDQLEACHALVASMPDLRFVLDHGGNPNIAAGEIDSWRKEISALATLPNVAVKLSGLVTRAGEEAWSVAQLQPYADHLMATFGQSRVLFGSDWPVCLLRCGYEQVVSCAEQLTAALNTDQRAAVFGANAVHWYRLGASR